MENKRTVDIERVTNELKTLAEDNKSEMSANVYKYLWDMIQSLEHEANTQTPQQAR